MSERPRILHIEDNAFNRILVKRLLEPRGYEVIEAEDGLSGVRKAQEVKPDLILMDINLPGLDGWETATKLKSLPDIRDTPIVALTSQTLDGDRERSLVAGCDGYIQKPIDARRFPDQIAEFLSGKRENLAGEEREKYILGYQRRLVERLEQQIRSLLKANEELAALNDIAKSVSRSLELDQVLHIILDKVLSVMKAERARIYLVSGEQGVPQLAAELLAQPEECTKSLSLQQEVVNDGEVYTAQRISVPLQLGDRCIGILEVLGRRDGDFEEHDRDLLTVIAAQVVGAIENARQVEIRERQLREQIAALRVEIDEVKRARQVGEVTESAFFQELQERARQLRDARREARSGRLRLS